jgi:hypothetical protein
MRPRPAALTGAGAIGKILEKSFKHLPASWLNRIDDLLTPRAGRHAASSEEAMRLPLHTTSPFGPGWKRAADIEPDPHYGQPRFDVAPLNTWNQVPATISPDIARIRGDLSDPWGTNPDTGLPFTQAQWTERFTTGTGDVRWPPNRGAVPGTRVEFTDANRFLETYGDQFDRVGERGGDFLGIPPGASFAERALPPGHMNRAVHDYTFDPSTLSAGVTIEVSEIAPAFGRPGGGIQVRFMEKGEAILVKDLIDKGILR